MADDSGFDRIGEDAFKTADEFSTLEKRRQLLVEKLNELGQSCRELLELNWSGKGMEEVAKLLNLTYGYARKKKCECMEKLVNLVKNSPDFNSLKW